MWAIGVIFFVLITGNIPYVDKNLEELEQEIKQGAWNQQLLESFKENSSAEML